MCVFFFWLRGRVLGRKGREELQGLQGEMIAIVTAGIDAKQRHWKRRGKRKRKTKERKRKEKFPVRTLVTCVCAFAFVAAFLL